MFEFLKMTPEEVDELDKEIDLAIDMMPVTDQERDDIIYSIAKSMGGDIWWEEGNGIS